MSNDVPRRSRLDQNTPAEIAIRAALDAVEAMPADVRLTDAVVLLQEARESVADYVDGLNKRRSMMLRTVLVTTDGGLRLGGPVAFEQRAPGKSE